LPFESGQATELEIKYGLGLYVAEREASDDLLEVLQKRILRFAAGYAAPGRDLGQRRKVCG